MPQPQSPFSPSAVALNYPKLRLPATTDPPSDVNPPEQKVWLVFGATGHIGRSVVKAALSHGDQVTAVGYTRENTMDQMQGWHERCHGLLCDVRIRETVEAVIKSSTELWGKIDVIVNCTGYGVIASCEDQDACDLRSQFETNFLGTLNIIQLSLPILRAQAVRRQDPSEPAGRYIIFSSMSGTTGVPGLGPYCATKYATEGLVESMLYEIDTFGIQASLVEPGHMRLDEPTGPNNIGRLMRTEGDESEHVRLHSDTVKLKKYGHFLIKSPSAPYDTPTAPAGHARRLVQWLTDRQPVSAVKSAELVWQLGHCRYPPLRLLLGSVAVDSVRDRLRSVLEEIEDWKHLHFPLSDGEECIGKGKGDATSRNQDIDEDDHQEADGAMDIDIKTEEIENDEGVD